MHGDQSLDDENQMLDITDSLSGMGVQEKQSEWHGHAEGAASPDRDQVHDQLQEYSPGQNANQGNGLSDARGEQALSKQT